MGKMLFMLFATTSLSCFSQTVVESKNLIEQPSSELQSVSGIQSVQQANQHPSTNTVHSENSGSETPTQSYSISTSNRMSHQQEIPEVLTKSEKISRLTHSIEAVEGKIFLLEEDSVGNAAELQEKYAKLAELQLELENVQNAAE